MAIIPAGNRGARNRLGRVLVPQPPLRQGAAGRRQAYIRNGQAPARLARRVHGAELEGRPAGVGSPRHRTRIAPSQCRTRGYAYAGPKKPARKSVSLWRSGY